MPPSIFAALLTLPLLAQSPEVATQDETVTFHSKVNLVLIPVVVRDKSGKAIGNLQKPDFQLLERNKPQEILKFSVERPGARKIPVVISDKDLEHPAEQTIDTPSHFVAYLFDDIHLEFGNLVYVRDAIRKHLAEHAQPGTRFSLYTTSGRVEQDFTVDGSSIEQALLRLQPQPVARSRVQECPDVSYFQADLILNRNDIIALGAAATEAKQCSQNPMMTQQEAETIARSAAQTSISAGEHESRVALISTGEVVKRLATMPGERTLLLLSPGFLRLNDHFSDLSSVMDRATRSNVTINALDARGLYTDMPDLSRRVNSVQAEQVKNDLRRQSARAEADVLAELAAGTGGSFMENTNDYNGAVDKLSDSPDVYYVLGFSPQNLKLDGAFHSVKVRIKEATGLTVTARRGYYAPRHLTDADEEAKQEISEALFSREESNEIPLDLHTQFFKINDTEAKLQVAAKLDVRNLHYRKADGVNNDVVKIVYGLFDRNGNYLQGVTKTVTMKLKDATLESRVTNGLTIRSDFKVTPGTYVIRLVARDAEGQMLSAHNGAVEIP